MERVLKRYQNLGVSTVGDYVANLREEAAFRSTLLQGLVWFVTLIALLGVANTQALSVVERTREIGLLRAIGMQPRQGARMLRAETKAQSLPVKLAREKKRARPSRRSISKTKMAARTSSRSTVPGPWRASDGATGRT